MKSLPLSYFLVASALYVCRTCAVTLTDISQLTKLTYDYVIIGGKPYQRFGQCKALMGAFFCLAGNAGLVIADRLTENSSVSVLVLEAGVRRVIHTRISNFCV